MKHFFRFWTTGSIAVVMAALGVGRGAMAYERPPVSQSSRFGMMETVQRIEACAHEHGLSVFTRLGPWARPCTERDEFTLIVFESSSGGTPVLMEGPGSQPELPLAVVVRAEPGGGAEVLFTGADWDDLPDTVVRDLTELPLIVADALR